MSVLSMHRNNATVETQTGDRKMTTYENGTASYIAYYRAAQQLVTEYYSGHAVDLSLAAICDESQWLMQVDCFLM